MWHTYLEQVFIFSWRLMRVIIKIEVREITFGHAVITWNFFLIFYCCKFASFGLLKVRFEGKKQKDMADDGTVRNGSQRTRSFVQNKSSITWLSDWTLCDSLCVALDWCRKQRFLLRPGLAWRLWPPFFGQGSYSFLTVDSSGHWESRNGWFCKLFRIFPFDFLKLKMGVIVKCLVSIFPFKG